MKALLVRCAAVATLLLVPAACSDDDDPGGPTGPSTSTVDTVRLTGVAFEPANLTVRPGRTVVWVNTQAIFHTVTPQGHTQWTRATTSAPGEVLRVTFNSAGEFPYVCEPHASAGMVGRITVQQ